MSWTKLKILHLEKTQVFKKILISTFLQNVITPIDYASFLFSESL